jgi:DNA topoisomerase-1
MGRAAYAKFKRLKKFGRSYPSLIKKIRADIKTSEAARVLYLISKTGFRIGSNSETLASVKAFGASTLRCSQVSVEGNKLAFDFIGKKGTRVSKVMMDPFLAKVIAGRCKSGYDQKIFRTTDKKIRGYFRSISDGYGFTVKDFRTYLGTMTAFRKIKTMSVPRNYREFKHYKKKVAETVAKELGNSPTVALHSYVSPEVFCGWETKEVLSMAAGEFLECIHYDREVTA